MSDVCVRAWRGKDREREKVIMYIDLRGPKNAVIPFAATILQLYEALSSRGIDIRIIPFRVFQHFVCFVSEVYSGTSLQSHWLSLIHI